MESSGLAMEMSNMRGGWSSGGISFAGGGRPPGGGRRVCHGAPATSAPVDHASRASGGRTVRLPRPRRASGAEARAMSSEALDVEPDEVSGAGRRAGLVGGAARGPGRHQRQRLRATGERRDLRRDDHTRGLRHRDGGHYRRPAPAPGDTRQGRPLHRTADTDRRLAGSGMSDAVLLDGPDPEGGGDAGQTPASAGAPVGVGRSVFRGRALDAIPGPTRRR